MDTNQLIAQWSLVIAGYKPSREQFELWLMTYELPVILKGIRATAKKNLQKGIENERHAIAFASKCMKMEAMAILSKAQVPQAIPDTIKTTEQHGQERQV